MIALSGIFGGFLLILFGGWDIALQTLIIFMVLDYVSGIFIAGILKKSSKAENGGLKSQAGWVGLAKKGMTLFVVIIAHRIDLILEVDYVRSVVIMGFLANESISILENAGIMGIPLPTALKNAIDILKNKSDNKKNN